MYLDVVIPEGCLNKKKEKTPSSTSCFHVDQENVGSLLL